MHYIELVISAITEFVENYLHLTKVLVVVLPLTGLFLTLRLAFVQIRRFKHGLEVTSGKYDDPNEPGDVSHFQALTTALSATVGVGNIAGVAIAIHWGGPGALFWMWVTAFFGMAVKYSEVTLALKYRNVEENKDNLKAWEGSVSGGPMYYIEKGLGSKWKPLAVFFALGLMMTSFLTGNAIQANTLSDQVESYFGLPPYVTGLISATFVGIIIFGGIKRIGKVTSILAPTMALLYIVAALIILGMNFGEIIPSLGLIVTEAFNPTAGVAGTGVGAFLLTLEWGIKRGLFSNEAGQGSAPIAHSAAQTDEPVSEGVVALLEPFIDTLMICTLTGLVIISTGVWNAKHPTDLEIGSGDASYITADGHGSFISATAPEEIPVVDGIPQYADGSAQFAWHDVAVDRFFADRAQTVPFNGTMYPGEKNAIAVDGSEVKMLYGNAVETGAPLTSTAFNKELGNFGELIVVLCVILFAVSTAISWSYYGDRCANYVFGKRAILIFKAVYVMFHFLGATASLSIIWGFGDVALSLVTLPNLLALFMLSYVVAKETNSYFQRKPWTTQPGKKH